jgi:hydroxymethylpyrimidine/phosphomethylpyrimidine kinase
MPSPTIPRVLSIAGSDSGGGAGIQADLKAIASCGAHGMTAVTAITAQNTVGVTAVHHVPGEMIIRQVQAVVADIGVDAIKIGMLGTVETIEAVRCALEEMSRDVPVVLDPVMVAESGAVLLEARARVALVERLLPWATVITPNLPEAREIARVADHAKQVEQADGRDLGDPATAGPEPDDPNGHADLEYAEARRLARVINQLSRAVVVLTGGHRAVAEDVFFDGRELIGIPGERQPDGAAHGSGCTHSSILAARLAFGDDPLTAARVARERAGRAIANGLREIGRGPGPVDALGIRTLAAK